MKFPYQYRKYQRDIIDDIREVIERGGHIALEAGLGSGKTVCALYPTISYAMTNDKKVLYLTRTNSQQKQVMHELRMLGAVGIGIQGRQNLCPLFKNDAELRHGSSEELSRICSDRKKRVHQGDLGACPYFSKTLIVDENRIRRWLEKVPTVEEFSSYCRKRNLCAYELTKRFLGRYRLVVAPYIYFFSGQIRKSLLDWMGAALEDIILVVDEAHNLPDYARELLTIQLSVQGLNLATMEAVEHGDEEVLEGVRASTLCMFISRLIKGLESEYLTEDDALIPRTAFDDELLNELRVSRNLRLLTKNLLLYGETIKEQKRKNGRLPRSHIFHVGSFLSLWSNTDDEEHVRLIMNKKNPTLQLYCLDPRSATEVIRRCHGSVHMSGTLHPLEEYRDSISLPDNTFLKRYPSPFPPENKAVFFTDDVTTKFEEFRKEENLLRLGDWIKRLAQVERNTSFFFPSYEVMSEFSTVRRGLGKKVFVESKGIGQEELIGTIRKFKASRNSVLFGVMGGRLCEGIDFPDEELEVVVIVGMPYPKPSAKQRALVLYYDIKFNKGWEYVVRAPMVRKLHQAIGRLIRKEDDVGIAVILDRRAAGFKNEIKGLTKLKGDDDPISKLEGFFTQRLPSSP